jgi:hypothetical protein
MVARGGKIMINESNSVPSAEDFRDTPNPSEIVETIKGKRGRKPGQKNKTSAKEAAAPVDPKYYSGEIWGEVINLPFRAMEIATQYPNWQIDKDQKQAMGEHLGTVIKGFFPELDKENEKYLALIALISLFVGTFGMKAAEWKIVTNSQKKAKTE